MDDADRKGPLGSRVPMDPVGLAVAYRLSATGEALAWRSDTFAPCDADGLRVEATFDGEVVEVAVVPAVPVVLDACEVVLRHAFATGEKVLMNGYQSWTDTAERPAWGRMRGLRGVPRAVVDRYALDAGGDYAMAGYSARRGRQHGFTYATFRRGAGMVLVGSLDEDRGFTLLTADAAAGTVKVEPECPQRQLAAGERAVLVRFAVVRGTLDECYDRWRDLAAWDARPVRPVVGYTSWYRHYGDIDEAKLQSDLAGAADALRSLRADLPQDAAGDGDGDGGPLGLFQIDDGYCKVGDWLDIDPDAFPRGLKPLADAARDQGLVPGLWVAPFVCERESRLFAEHPDWLLRDDAGDPVPTGCQWSGGFALDTRNVDVRSYVLEVLQAMVREWGFGLLKADFLYAACLRPHDGLNRGELMADALDLLRAGAGERALLLGCGVPLGSAFGRVDYCRIGCDVGLDWDDKPHMRLLHRERVSTRNSLASTCARRPLDGRAFGNDPDVFFLRPDVRLSRVQRDELLFADAESGSVLLTSDDMGAWDDEARARYRQAVRMLLARAGRTPGERA